MSSDEDNVGVGLSAEEWQRLASELGTGLTPDQLMIITDYIRAAGGIDEALEILESLDSLVDDSAKNGKAA